MTDLPQMPGLGEAEGRSQELHRGLPCGCRDQVLESLSLPPRVSISQELDQKQSLDTNPSILT